MEPNPPVPPPILVESPEQQRRRRRRRGRRSHRLVTMPAGLFMFSALALPGYADCDTGHVHAIDGDLSLTAVAVFGLAIAAIAWLGARRSQEVVFAILATIGSSVAAVYLFVFAIFVDGLNGLYLQLAASVAAIVGSSLWISESASGEAAEPEGAPVVAIVLAALALVADGLVAARAPRDDGPERPAHQGCNCDYHR